MQKISIGIFAIAFLSINCSFLRSLAEVSITANTGAFNPSTVSCLNDKVNYTITITNAVAINKLKATLNDAAKTEITCDPIKAGDTKISCVGPKTGIKIAAEYGVGALVKAEGDDSGNTLGTFSDDKKVKVLAAPALGEVTKSQSVDGEKGEAFKVLFADTATYAPQIYIQVGTTQTLLSTEICSFSSTSHDVTCTLKKDNGIVKDGDEFSVLYDKDCVITDTGIKVKYSSSTFAKVGALIFAIALLF